MIKKLTKVGNSKAVILPAQMIIKFKLGKTVMIKETEEGILITSTKKETLFQRELRKYRENKEQIKKEMKAAAESPEAQAYYANPENNLGEDALEVFDNY